MSLKLKKSLIMLMILVFFICTLVYMKNGYAHNTKDIDLFTQKEPYSGKGLNMPSDAFAPEETVILYALVTDNGVPLQNLLVTFYIQSPDGTSFSLTSKTNESGIAMISFAIPQKCEDTTKVFGEWFALANVQVGADCLTDTLTFKVDWIIKLISVRTIDENLTYRSIFGIDGDVGLEIALRNIAMCMKNTTLAIVIQDELNVPVNYSEIPSFDVPPNEKLIFIYCKLHLPKWTHVGNATVSVSALTASADQTGVPYCPAIFTDFFIRPYKPLRIALHDVAVIDVVPSARSVEPGQVLTINAVVRNEGTESESFIVNAYCNDTLIETLEVVTLSPYSKKLLNFTLNTSIFEEGNYTLKVSIPLLIKEADSTDNTFVDRTIEIKQKPLLIVHDVAIIEVSISKTVVYIGESLQINVTVINEGTETETFNLSTYYDSSLIGTQEVVDLQLNTEITLTFIWNTSQVQENFYQIKAYATPDPQEIDILDNTYLDGIVQVKAKPSPSKIHDVAVLNVTPSKTTLYIGEICDVHIVVKNEGNFTESFKVVVYYDLNVAGTVVVDSLMPNSTKRLVFHWSTLRVKEGNYTLSAWAEEVEGEQDIDDNYAEDGTVEVKEAPARWFVLWWLWWVLLLLLIPLVLLIIWLYLRKRRKKQEKAFHQGWTAWYYCLDLKRKPKTKG